MKEQRSCQINKRVRIASFKSTMDYSAVVDSICTERLDLVEILTENRLQLLDTLHSLHPLMILRDVLPVIAQYCKLKSDISSMLKDMDALEQTLVSRIS